MASSNLELVRTGYDRIAQAYDSQWTPHVKFPQHRLTLELGLKPGERVLDLACGTGVDSVAMLERVPGGRVVAVDCSSEMLAQASALAKKHGLVLETLHDSAEHAVEVAEPASFDVISLRFALAYLDMPSFFPTLLRPLGAGGRLGILTSLGSSLPTVRRVVDEVLGELSLPPVPICVPLSLAHLTEALRGAGFSHATTWSHSFGVRCPNGRAAIDWLLQSGYVTHPRLESAPKPMLAAFESELARRIDRATRGDEVVLEFDLAGVVARA